MKVAQKVLIIFLLLMAFIYTISPIVLAGEDINPDDYQLKEPLTYEEGEEVFKIGIAILRVLRALAAIIAVVAISIVGLQYMVGSVEEKAQYKEKMLPIVIGGTLIASLSTILISIYKIMN